MAYSDYVQIYKVTDVAGITSDDDLEAQVTKIAAWINDNFSDTLTARTPDNIKVVVTDNDTGFGTAWGSVYDASNTNDRKKAWYNNGSYSYYGYRSSGYTIDSIGFFICRGTNGYVFDFIHLTATDTMGTPCVCIADCTTAYGTKKTALSYAHVKVLNFTKDEGINSVKSYAPQYMPGYRNPTCSQTLLTRYSPYGSDAICDGVYKIDGKLVTNKAIFELDGSKFLCLDWYGSSYYELALKLT